MLCQDSSHLREPYSHHQLYIIGLYLNIFETIIKTTKPEGSVKKAQARFIP